MLLLAALLALQRLFRKESPISTDVDGSPTGDPWAYYEPCRVHHRDGSVSLIYPDEVITCLASS